MRYYRLASRRKKNSITEQQPQALPPVTPPPVSNTPTPPPVVNTIAPPPIAQAPPQPKADAPKQETPVAQAPPVSRPQAGRGMPPMGGSSFSITQRLNKEFEKKEEESNANLFASTDGLPQTDFTEGRLLNLWESYADAVGAEGKYNLRSILKTANPVIGNGYRLSITVASVTAVDEINREKIALLEYLRKELNNYVIDLDVNVNTQEKGNLKPYTPAQKFQFLAEKNPVLEKLKQKLDLDVDF